MPKGGVSRSRSGGNGRAGLRDTPAELREILQKYIENPALLDGLPPGEREVRQQQIAHYESVRRMRSAATRRGHETRRLQREAREPVWRLQERLAEAVIAKAAADADELSVGSDTTSDAFFEELADFSAEEAAVEIREAAAATERVSEEFAEKTRTRRHALETRYSDPPEAAK